MKGEKARRLSLSATGPDDSITVQDALDAIRRTAFVRVSSSNSTASSSKAKHTVKSRWQKLKSAIGVSSKASSAGMFEGCIEAFDFQRILDQWLKLCSLNNMPLQEVDKIVTEFDKRGRQTTSKEVKAKLNLSDCNLSDEQLQLLCRVLVGNPKIASLDVSKNSGITRIGLYTVLQLLLSQVEACRLLKDDAVILHNIFIGEVMWDRVPNHTLPTSSEEELLADMLDKASNELKIVNIKNLIKRLYDKYDLEREISSELCFKVFQKVVGKGQGEYTHCLTEARGRLPGPLCYPLLELTVLLGLNKTNAIQYSSKEEGDREGAEKKSLSLPGERGEEDRVEEEEGEEERRGENSELDDEGTGESAQFRPFCRAEPAPRPSLPPSLYAIREEGSAVAGESGVDPPYTPLVEIEEAKGGEEELGEKEKEMRGGETEGERKEEREEEREDEECNSSLTLSDTEEQSREGKDRALGERDSVVGRGGVGLMVGRGGNRYLLFEAIMAELRERASERDGEEMEEREEGLGVESKGEEGEEGEEVEEKKEESEKVEEGVEEVPTGREGQERGGEGQEYGESLLLGNSWRDEEVVVEREGDKPSLSPSLPIEEREGERGALAHSEEEERGEGGDRNMNSGREERKEIGGLEESVEEGEEEGETQEEERVEEEQEREAEGYSSIEEESEEESEEKHENDVEDTMSIRERAFLLLSSLVDESDEGGEEGSRGSASSYPAHSKYSYFEANPAWRVDIHGARERGEGWGREEKVGERGEVEEGSIVLERAGEAIRRSQLRYSQMELVSSQQTNRREREKKSSAPSVPATPVPTAAPAPVSDSYDVPYPSPPSSLLPPHSTYTPSMPTPAFLSHHYLSTPYVSPMPPPPPSSTPPPLSPNPAKRTLQDVKASLSKDPRCLDFSYLHLTAFDLSHSLYPSLPLSLFLSLHTADFSHNTLTSHLSTLHLLERCVNLTSLSLFHCHLQGEVDCALSLPRRLTALDLSHNHISSLSHLHTHCVALRKLNLAHNDISRLPFLPLSLSSLSLSHNKLGDATVLRVLAYNVHLQELWIESNPISCSALEGGIRQLIPHIRYVHVENKHTGSNNSHYISHNNSTSNSHKTRKMTCVNAEGATRYKSPNRSIRQGSATTNPRDTKDTSLVSQSNSSNKHSNNNATKRIKAPTSAVVVNTPNTTNRSSSKAAATFTTRNSKESQSVSKAIAASKDDKHVRSNSRSTTPVPQRSASRSRTPSQRANSNTANQSKPTTGGKATKKLDSVKSETKASAKPATTRSESRSRTDTKNNPKSNTNRPSNAISFSPANPTKANPGTISYERYLEDVMQKMNRGTGKKEDSKGGEIVNDSKVIANNNFNLEVIEEGRIYLEEDDKIYNKIDLSLSYSSIYEDPTDLFLEPVHKIPFVVPQSIKEEDEVFHHLQVDEMKGDEFELNIDRVINWVEMTRSKVFRCQVVLQELIDLANISDYLSLHTKHSIEEEWKEIGFYNDRGFISLEIPAFVAEVQDDVEINEVLTKWQEFYTLFMQIHSVLALCSETIRSQKLPTMLKKLLETGVGASLNAKSNYVFEIRV